MFSLNFIKFFGLFALAVTVSSACRFWQKTDADANGPPPYAVEELVSEIPFSNKEPEVFQLEIVITAGGSENRIFAARNGARRRFDYGAGAKSKVSLVEADKNYLLIESRKVYAERAAENSPPEENWTDFLTTEWLSAKPDAKFFKLEAENNLARYRVVLGDADAAKSESLIFVDEGAGLPVRQEFYSLEGDQRTLTMTVELKNLKLEADDELFLVPKDFKKVSIEEFRAILRKETTEGN
jgi:hypothetical protein